MSNDKPHDIPSSPERVYENEWKGMGDWLGTGTIAPQLREYMPFEEAKDVIHSLHMKSIEEWFEYCKAGKKPKNLPTNPSVVYEEDWKGWPRLPI
jgi:Phage-integrase repeat unit